MTGQTLKRPVRQLDPSAVGDFYDRIYYRNGSDGKAPAFHLRRLARRFEPWAGRRILDVACGSGSWLEAVAARGAIVSGIDISQVALDACGSALPEAEIHCGRAEHLPFADRQFDFISCLGALEHFLDPEASLREMVRVAKSDAYFLLLVLTRTFCRAVWGCTAVPCKQASKKRLVRSSNGSSSSGPRGCGFKRVGRISTYCRLHGFFAAGAMDGRSELFRHWRCRSGL
jgi:SAM-dependent methyltransferase